MSAADEIAQRAAERVREAIAEAEQRAAEIVERAEVDAKAIRDKAENVAREQLERAQAALRELAGETPAAPAPDPTAPDLEPPAPTSDSGPPDTPAPGPQISAEADAAGNGDDAAARLVAMKLALDGKNREEIEAELDEKFGSADRGALLDDVLARAGK